MKILKKINNPFKPTIKLLGSEIASVTPLSYTFTSDIWDYNYYVRKERKLKIDKIINKLNGRN